MWNKIFRNKVIWVALQAVVWLKCQLTHFRRGPSVKTDDFNRKPPQTLLRDATLADTLIRDPTAVWREGDNNNDTGTARLTRRESNPRWDGQGSLSEGGGSVYTSNLFPASVEHMHPPGQKPALIGWISSVSVIDARLKLSWFYSILVIWCVWEEEKSAEVIREQVRRHFWGGYFSHPAEDFSSSAAQSHFSPTDSFHLQISLSSSQPCTLLAEWISSHGDDEMCYCLKGSREGHRSCKV